MYTLAEFNQLQAENETLKVKIEIMEREQRVIGKQRNPNDFKITYSFLDVTTFKNKSICVTGNISKLRGDFIVSLDNVELTKNDRTALTKCYAEYTSKKSRARADKIIQAIKDKNK